MNRVQLFLQIVRHGWRLIGATMLVAAGALPARGETPPDVDRLAALGAKTIKRLETEPAWWRAVHDSADGFADVKVVRDGDKSRIIVTRRAGADEAELADIVVRDGAWYVTEFGKSAKYRPYEAPLSLPMVYFYISRSEPTVGSAELLKETQFDKQKDGVVYYRMPATDEQRRSIQGVLDSLHKLKASASGKSFPEAPLNQLRLLEDFLDRGVPIGIDVSNGLVVSSGIQGRRLWIKDFQIVETIRDSMFAIDGTDWTDESGPLAEDAEQVAMFAHCSIWRPEMPKPELQAVLVDIKDGRCRRVPFLNGIAIGDSFSLDRKKVYVGGLAGADGGMAVYEIDLDSGENRRVAASSLRGITMGPRVSPDGTKLVAMERDARRGLLDVQMWLVDLASDEARRLGEPFDMNKPSWLPDGTGLITERRVYESLDKPAVSTICRINIENGARTYIRPGNDPVVLRQSKHILFEEADGDGHVWKICDFDGSNVKLVGNGLREFSFAAPSPTGDQVILMKFGGPDGPRPYIVDPLTGKAKSIPVGPGLWAFPVWQ